MNRKLAWIYSLLLLFLLPAGSFAHEPFGLKQAPQPTTCISGTFTRVSNNHWHTVTLKLKNNCATAVDFQNASITFKNASSLNTKFWGNFGPLTYPDNDLQIVSQPDPSGGFLATLSIHIPAEPGANSKLPANKSIKIKYGTATADYVQGSVNVYLGTQPQTAEIDLTNSSDKPANVSQNFAVVDISSNGQVIKSVQLPWKGTQQVLGLTPATYNIQPNNVSDSQGNVYQGTAAPAVISLSAGQIASSTISYSLVAQLGKISVRNGPLPSPIAGYPNNPVVTFTQTDTGATSTKEAPWNVTTLMDQLVNNKNFRFSTPDITFNNNKCTATFTPPEAVSNATTPPTTTLSYACVVINQVNATVNVTGLTSSTTAVDVTFTPNNGTAPVVKHVNLTNGSGTDVAQLTQGVVYNVSSTAVTGFTATFNPQPLTANTNATETVTYQAIPPTQGNLTVILPASPGAGVGNPTITVTGGGTTRQQVVTWGNQWALTNLATGSYTVTSSNVTNGTDTYQAAPITATVNAGATTTVRPTYTAVQPGRPASWNDIKHVVIIMMENTNADDAFAQPFMKSLATSRGAYTSQYFALTHPSEPNYIAMVAGSTLGVDSDDDFNLNARHVGDLFDAKGLTWKAYAEGLPTTPCFKGSFNGKYARKHEPFISFLSVQNNAAQCAKIVNGPQFFTDLNAGRLPTFSYYVPDEDNDGHDTGVQFADQWLSRTFGPIFNNASVMADTLFIIVFDEDDSGNNRVYASFVGAAVKPGVNTTKRYNHYSLLRTIEEIFQIGTLGLNDQSAVVINDIWK